MKLILGKAVTREGEKPFEIDAERHAAFFGKSGVGKTTLFKNIVVEHLRQGRGVGVIDPHGDLINELLEHVPEDRVRDVVLFDPLSAYPIGLNIVEGKDGTMALDALKTLIRKLWPDGWGPRTDEAITAIALAILEKYPNPTILHVFRFFTREKERKWILEQSTNPVVRDYGKKIAGWDKRMREEAFAPGGNKIAAFVTNPIIRAVYGQAKSLPVDEIMNGRKILLVRLPKGALGTDACRLFGRTIVMKIFRAALERESIPQSERVPFLLLIDEVANFADAETLSEIYSEARKYKLTLFTGAQVISQIEDPDEMFGNCTTVCTFRVGGKDAERIAQEFGNEEPPRSYLNLSDRALRCVTVRDGRVVGPLHVSVSKPVGRNGKEAAPEQVRRWSESNWGKRREQVEREILEFLSKEIGDGVVRAGGKSAPGRGRSRRPGAGSAARAEG